MDPSRAGQNARSTDADGRRLAGAVRAKQAIQFALPYAEAYAIHGNDVLSAFIDLAKALDLDNDCQTFPHSISSISHDLIIGIYSPGPSCRDAG
jgi:hypothetical protein